MALGGDQPSIMQYSYGFFDAGLTAYNIRDFAKTPSPALNSDEADTTVPETVEAISEPTEDSTPEKLRVSFRSLGISIMSHLKCGIMLF